MKVLWFSNTSSLADEKSLSNKSRGTGNWISSLEEEICKIKDINLYIAFHGNNIKEIKEKHNATVTYFIIPAIKETRLQNILSNWISVFFAHKIRKLKIIEREVSFYHEVIRRVNPEIIQIFGFENNFVRILPKTTVPVIIHIQGILNIITSYLLGNFSPKEIKPLRFKDIIKGDAFIKYSLELLEKATVEKNVYQQCAYYFGRTDMDKRATLLFSPKAKYFHCDEIMRKEFYKESWHKARNNKIVLYTTLNDIPYKGTDQVFVVSDLLKKNRGNINFEWNIAGLSEKSITVKALRRRGFVNTPYLNFLGNLTAEEIILEMKKADVFVYTSFIENGCNAVQEAMLVGMPIVCTYSGGMSTTLKNYETGLLVQHGDSYSMAGAILELIDDFELAKKIGENARKVSHIRHNRENIVTILTNTYNQIIRENKDFVLSDNNK